MSGGYRVGQFLPEVYARRFHAVNQKGAADRRCCADDVDGRAPVRGLADEAFDRRRPRRIKDRCRRQLAAIGLWLIADTNHSGSYRSAPPEARKPPKL